MLDTLRAGLGVAPEGAFAFAPADAPFLVPALIAELRAAFESGGSRYLVPVHGGRGGHPAFARDAAAFLDPALEGGARAVWRGAGDELLRLQVESADVLFDVDTPADLAAAGTLKSRRIRLVERGDLTV